MIKLTIGEALAAVPALRNVMGVKMPVRAAYWLTKIARKMDAELADFEKQRVALVEELGEKDEAGNRAVKADRMVEFHKRLSELVPVELSLDVEPVLLDSLGAAEVSPADLLALEKFIVNGEAK